MNYITKNKVLIIAYALTIALLFSVFIERQKELWGKTGLIVLAIITVLLYIINTNKSKYFTLNDDILTVRQTFSKQKQYSLKNVSGWTENHYHLLEIKTSREIVLKMTDGTKINLFKRNSKDFEKLSDYLNENLSEAYKTI
ncbi:hypothetical protein [Flavobacterium aquicola]|uniref:PH (Pleckstrin Homology) domain-containing protein n=1 Tax=Flavobacterium aquicola TaxID=1682742 RepID=A0A3E0EU86_9FLAO|nr:hypothetical protein [Flavobacterium aquicola]REH01241.1 hypothetical protein C8P67_102508 [Flavobacterium aquicola]